MCKLIIAVTILLSSELLWAQTNSALNKLAPLNLKLKMFDSSNEDTSNPFGFSYSLSEHVDLINIGEEPSISNNYKTNKMIAKIDANGNYAFDQTINPADFLSTKINLSWRYQSGGFFPLTEKEKQRKNELVALLIADGITPEQRKTYQKELARLASREDSANSSNHIRMDFGLDYGLESNQSFSQKQTVIGGKFLFAYDGLTDQFAESYQETSLIGKLNLLDYPFAFIRQLTGYNTDTGKASNQFTPSNQYFPTLSLALHEVDPHDNDPRSQVGDGSSFNRFDAAINFKTPIMLLDSKERIYFVLNSRYFKELDADNAVKDFNLDKYRYTELSLEGENVYVSYTTGKLPFESEKDKRFEVGWKLNFD